MIGDQYMIAKGLRAKPHQPKAIVGKYTRQITRPSVSIVSMSFQCGLSMRVRMVCMWEETPLMHHFEM